MYVYDTDDEYKTMIKILNYDFIPKVAQVDPLESTGDPAGCD